MGFFMYPARRHLFYLKVSFETAVRSHLLAALFGRLSADYRADA